MAFARAFVVHSLDGRPSVYYQTVAASVWQRDEGAVPPSEKGALAVAVVKAVQHDALMKHSYGDEVCEGVVSIGGHADEAHGIAYDAADHTEGVVAVWKQLKGTAFTLVVPHSANLAVASHHLTVLIRLLQQAYGHKGFEFEPKDLLLKPDAAHVVLSKALPNGFVPVVQYGVLRQSVKRATDALK